MEVLEMDKFNEKLNISPMTKERLTSAHDKIHEASDLYITDFANKYSDYYVSADDSRFQPMLGNILGSNKDISISWINNAVADCGKSYVDSLKNERKIKVELTSDILVNLYSLTDNNQHVAVRYEIANYLNTYSDLMYEFVVYFKSMLDDKKLMNARFSSAYFVMEKLMFVKIYSLFGIVTAKLLYACL